MVKIYIKPPSITNLFYNASKIWIMI